MPRSHSVVRTGEGRGGVTSLSVGNAEIEADREGGEDSAVLSFACLPTCLSTPTDRVQLTPNTAASRHLHG
jgi:hypothetical protein